MSEYKTEQDLKDDIVTLEEKLKGYQEIEQVYKDTKDYYTESIQKLTRQWNRLYAVRDWLNTNRGKYEEKIDWDGLEEILGDWEVDK